MKAKFSDYFPGKNMPIIGFNSTGASPLDSSTDDVKKNPDSLIVFTTLAVARRLTLLDHSCQDMTFGPVSWEGFISLIKQARKVGLQFLCIWDDLGVGKVYKVWMSLADVEIAWEDSE